MTSSGKALLAALLIAMPLPVGARVGGDDSKTDTTIVVAGADDDDVQVDAPRRFRFSRSGAGGFLGVSLIGITPELRAHYGAPKDAGVLVGRVEKDSAAAKAGLEVGDILTSVAGEHVESPGEVTRALRGHRKGDSVKLEVLRNRATKTLTATLDERPRRDGEWEDFGELRELPGMLRREFRSRPWTVEVPDTRIVMPRSEDLRRLRERLEDLEKRLKDLEKKKTQL
ncbi:MAG TPA: PDZ domain-containing protein [Thermoanaerobaculia bacterium]|nr:PDZ domain-containing protein [Thermoanaerobaculia bacterium]